MKYNADWLPLTDDEPGYNIYVKAEKIRKNTDKLNYTPCLLGGLDHIAINGPKVRYCDIGMNDKTIDLLIDTQNGSLRTI